MWRRKGGAEVVAVVVVPLVLGRVVRRDKPAEKEKMKELHVEGVANHDVTVQGDR